VLQNSKDNRNPKKKTDILPNNGLSDAARHAVVKILNITLADETVLRMKTRTALTNAHHVGSSNQAPLFDQFKQFVIISNAITNRVYVLGNMLACNDKELLRCSRLDEQPGLVPSMISLLADHEAVMRYLRLDAESCLKEHEDQITGNLLANILVSHEKMAGNLLANIGTGGEQ
jgi:starvation-inducible DNA-binding protein